MSQSAIRVHALTKAFGRNRVLRGVDLDLPAGRVTVLMGANGAGKSTLVKVLCGVLQADGGTMLLAGATFAPQSPAAALRAGVVTVHQNINDGVVPDLDIASNLLLDTLAERGHLFLRTGRMRAEARRIAAAVGLEIDVTRRVAGISLADRQLVAIARAMARRPRVLILDEPTSSLSLAEAQRLFAVIDRLRSEGVAILYISHRMSDIRRLADRIVSMRDGQVSGVFESAPPDYSGAVRAMLGHEITEVGITVPPPGRAVLTAAALHLRPDAVPFDMALHENEVVAVTGLVGSGKSALAAALFGLQAPVGGAIRLDGAPFAPANPAAAMAAGVFLAAKDRLINAVIPAFDIQRNLTLPFTRRHSGKLGLMRGRSERARAVQSIAQMGVVCQGARDNILTLSGGNQQKVVVGRWLAEDCRLLILDEPFQGVDIQARQDIGRHIRNSAARHATLVLCAEIDEALEVADRILVMSEHTVIGDHRNENIDLDRLMAEVSGVAARLGNCA